MRFLTFILIVFLSSWSAWARPEHGDVREALDRAVQYLDLSQQKVTSGEDYFSGEWPSTMRSTRRIPLIGPAGTGGYDSNSFTVSSIHNALASIWKRQQLERIPPMLDLSMERILSYQNGDSFNFWPLLEPKLYQSTDPAFARIRRPNHFPIKYARLEAGCNVYNDADDTAVAFTAMQNYNLVRPENALELPSEIGPVFSRFRDVNRWTPHFYNLLHRTINTGAFMTWLEDEKPFRPKSYIPSTNRFYLPFGLNDVDCVVNANVLNALARYDELDTPGVKEACRYIERAFRKGRQKSCGVYYPSPFNAHYVVAKAFDAGVKCLEPAVKIAVKDILKKQLPDGSWRSSISGDDVHTSLYALNALLYAGQFETFSSGSAIDLGIGKALLSGHKNFDGSMSWKEGVFFSGGTFARHWIFWKSEAYTTSLAADALSLYLERHGNMAAE
ncbi:MAG: hypothetical protein A2X94_15435 [Bdellovibrionales bacterium GWB1_55_8]|nr:MAG: hypothetical protein A2X94_15435 [Bdellovibrionales bacterium GWB1_55_8]